MPTFNGENYVAEQIESILNQSYQNFELRIYDDGSLDNTVKIVQSYVKRHTCITLHQNKTNIGVVQTIENALMACQYHFIALSDQDDIWHYNKLQQQVEILSRYETDYSGIPLLVHSDLEMIDAFGKTLYASYFDFRGYAFSSAKSLNTIISQNGVMGNTIMFNANLRQLILPFPKYLAVHDYWIALINEIYGRRVTLHQPLVQYRIHDTNQSNRVTFLEKRKSNFIKNIVSRDFNLPYMGISRDKVLRELIDRHELIEEDRVVIEKFLTYLEFNINRLILFFILVKYNFVKIGLFYRIKLFFKLLLTRKYSH